MDEIKFDTKNYRKHSDDNKRKIAKSLKECGAGRSIVIDSEGEIIAGNGVYEQAKKKGMPVRIIETDGSELVVVKRTDLATADEKRKLLAMADNATSDAVDWDMDALTSDFDGSELGEWGIDCKIETGETSEDDEVEHKRKEFEDKMAKGELSEDDPEYQEFVNKFNAKRTTDDCYTPTIVYEAIAQYVADHYHESRSSFVRPFYPGGDYEHENYPKGCVVVDNPPFSILAQIIKFYCDRGVKFFLFAPYLTILGTGKNQPCTAIITSNTITYENGANVNTSFITNLEPQGIRAKSDPVLSKIIKEANERNLAETRRELPRYSFPDNVLTASMFGRFAKAGVLFEIRRDQCTTIGELDEMKAKNKGIYGSGLLVSDKAAKSKIEADEQATKLEAAKALEKTKTVLTKWTLSKREKDIISKLS